VCGRDSKSQNNSGETHFISLLIKKNIFVLLGSMEEALYNKSLHHRVYEFLKKSYEMSGSISRSFLIRKFSRNSTSLIRKP